MEAVMFGKGTTHDAGEFCKRLCIRQTFIGCFETPFLYERDGQLLRGEAGDMLIIPPGQPVYHGPVPEANTGFVNDWVYLDGGELDALLQKYPLPLNTAFPMGGGPMRRYVEQLEMEAAVRDAGSADQIYFLTGQLILGLYRQYHRQQTDNTPAQRLAQVREELLQQPKHPWTLREMAQLCGYSASRFSALYRAQFGISPKQELLNARIELAAKLLRYTNASVTSIAAECGFQSIYYFSKYFKAAKGIPPSEFAAGRAGMLTDDRP